MKLNTKDLLSAGLFIAFAVIGLWLNQDHNLGTARRMGPGYMPMLTFWLLIGLGSLVLAGGLFNGPDPLAKWTPGEIGFLIAGAVAGVVAGMIAARIPGFPSVPVSAPWPMWQRARKARVACRWRPRAQGRQTTFWLCK